MKNSPRRARAAMAAILMLASTAAASAQTVTKFPIPTANSGAQLIAAGPDGALWFTEQNSNKIGRITAAGSVTEFAIPTAVSLVVGITAGPDGNLWFAESAAPGDSVGGLVTSAPGAIGRITPTGTITEFPIPTANARVNFIAAGPDGALWFTEKSGNKIGRITTSGVITEFTIPTAISSPGGIAAGPDGNLWFTERGNAVNMQGVPSGPGRIGRITTAGTITEFPLPSTAQPLLIAAGPDGNLWFSEVDTGKIGRITTGGTVTEFAIPTASSQPTGIAAGPDGALWFAEAGAKNVGRITTSGSISEFQVTTNAMGLGPSGVVVGPDGALWFLAANDNLVDRITTTSNPIGVTLVSAILPSSRSIEVGATATAFATMFNVDTGTATSCGLVPTSTVPATFLFQTTDPNTNALTGSPNTRVDIPAGKSQSFVFAFTANAAFAPTDVAIGFACANENAAAINSGLNTLLLSGSASPVPDIVALAASGDPGIVDIPGNTGTGAFAVATVNVGASASITATADTGAASLPLTALICQTNPGTGACITAMGPSVTTTINANATPTFAIFVTGSGAVPFSPAANRIFVRFKDAGGVTRGSTSVAVRTQ